jgi:exonuclease III
MHSQNNIRIAFINIHGQSGLTYSKEKQIEDFVQRNNVDILHCQEINIDENSFSCCNFISANYHILSNNAINKYGTATIIRNSFTAENVRMDTIGRAIFFNIDNLTLGNVYLHPGTDSNSRGAREKFCAETIPQLLVNHKSMGVWGGDLNCITKHEDCTNNPA